MSDDQQTPPAESSAGGPAAPERQELTPEQVHALIVQDVLAKLHFVCRLFAPSALRDPEQLAKLADVLATQQLEIRERAMPTILDPKQVQINPRMGIRLHSHVRPQPFVLHGPKRMHVDSPPDELLASVATLALMLAPEWRGLLMLYGVRVEFFQGTDPGKPRVQLAHSMPPRPRR